MSFTLETAHVQLASHPPSSSGQLALLAMLGAVWRRKLLMLGIVTASLLLGIAAAASIPPRYAAQAYIRGELVAQDMLPMQVKNMSTGTMSSGPMSLDAMRVIETQSRLLQSNRLARRVAEQIGLDRLQSVLGNAAKSRGDPLDSAAEGLLSALSVTTDSRAYLITVSHRSGDPDLSMLIANSFVAELLRSTRLQVLFQQRYNAQAELSLQLAKFGEKHPKVAALRTQLAATDETLKRQMNESPEAILQDAGEYVNGSTAVSAPPTSRFVIGLFLLVGLVLGLGVALWLDRRKWWAC